MAAPEFRLRAYQVEVLDQLAAYLRKVQTLGDAPYYGRFGFRQELTGRLVLLGPVERERFLGLELVPGALKDAQGAVIATGALETARVLRQLTPRSSTRARASAEAA